jgi:CDP-diacylglycerol--serine O-phosphatidyltransferase
VVTSTGVVTLPSGPDTGLQSLAGHLAGEPRLSGEPLARIIAPAGPTLPPPVLPPADLTPPGWPASTSLSAGRTPVGFDTGFDTAGAGSGAAHAAPPGPVPLLPGEPTVARRIRFVAVNACTIASLVLGMSAIFMSMHGGVGVRWAALCLVGCVTFDGLDGALARRLGVASPFGAQMDSLADMCSFGIAAPVVVYAAVHGTARTGLVAAACVLVAACSAIRLARFNVSPKDGRFFCGVPTTMAAAVLGLAVLIGLRPSGTVAVAAIAVLALAMVSGFPYAKLARIVKLPPWLWLAPVIGAFVDYRITFAALVALYLASGPLLWLRQRA